MELLQLRYFYESAKSESLTKTAQKYLVPTTSVSASIKRLESELGAELFDRTCNRVYLNDNGKMFMNSLSSVFKSLDTAVDNLKVNSREREIKMLVRGMRKQVTNKVIQFRKRNKQVSFKIIYDFARKDIDNFDIIIDEKSDKYNGFLGIPFSDAKIGLITSADSPLRGKKLTLFDLKNEPFISISDENNLHKMLVSACSRAGFKPNFAVYSNDNECYELLIKAGVGIGLAGVTLGEQDGFCLLNVTDFNENYPVFAYYREENAYGMVKKFLEFLNNN